MVFKEGDTVEVLRSGDGPLGSWYSAKIVLGDVGNYLVRYQLLLTVNGDPILERVSEDDIRPIPALKVGGNWLIGDTIEAFDGHCWRVGKVSDVLHNGWFIIEFFGSSQFKSYHKSSIRDHQSWQGNEWILLGKGAGNINLDDMLSSSRHSQKSDIGVQKMKKNESSFDNVSIRGIHKRRSVAKGNGYKGIAMGKSFTLPEKMHPVSFPQKRRGGKPMFSFTVERKSGGFEVEKTDACPIFNEFSEGGDSNCSIASCSGGPRDNFLGDCYALNSRQPSKECDMGISFDGGKAYSESEFRGNSSSSEELATNVHMLELNAYHHTVQALHASGPLSWEQEALLTNLRLSLHITNEEHLFELRHLCTPQVV
ncbi:uncharacterized protein LOC18429557 [Amborella trichopoda]|uniref:ENT domain-containing protein n=1 Tax=Amborella trichopoda TaxID=13333 RepID=W1P1E9_AMBTC|nr:uncharacterized protein LOC18429557 [Amborella trichopoda]XP_020520232.1 uncharacterized protein LOC18429557 [Amborella trichopoda]ERN01474.1 hypothetical protein AMTR_s00002p00269570 [Amborella trichopoda]|eukprot:XP_006838905.1 uncharacterized protein LOC18429557 [Amborella trichopoda]